MLCLSSKHFRRSTSSNNTLDCEVPFQNAASAIELSVKIKSLNTSHVMFANKMFQSFNKVVKFLPVGGLLFRDF
jgi:hypothetical protein